MRSYPITVRTNGKIYGGWTSLKVKHSIEAVSGSFDVGLSERWSGQPVRWPILPGDAVAVEILDQPVITGWVDDLKPHRRRSR